LTASREFKSSNARDIRHSTHQTARRSTFWEHAGALIDDEHAGNLTSSSDLDDTVKTWQSMNLYEMSTTQCARFTQSKVKPVEISEVEPSVTDVQQDFDINSPIASETFSKKQAATFVEDFQVCQTDSNLQERLESFQLDQSQSTKSVTAVPYPCSTFASATSKEVLASEEPVSSPELKEDEEAKPPLPTTLSPIRMYDTNDVATQSYSTVDEFDEPKKKPTVPYDSFDKLLSDPNGPGKPGKDSAIVSTLSGQWGKIAKSDIGSGKPVLVQYFGDKENNDVRRVESFEIRSYHSFIASLI